MPDQLQKPGGNLAGSIHRGLLAGLLLVVAAQPLVFSQAEGGKDSAPKPEEETSRPKPSYDLVGWGQLKPVKGNEGFYDFSCTAREKGRWKKLKVFVKLSDGLKVLADRRVKLTEFKNDLSTRFSEAKVKLDEQRAQNGAVTDTAPMVSPTTSAARPLPN